MSGLGSVAKTREANEVVNDDALWSGGDWRLGSIGGDMDVDGFRRKFILLLEDDIEADGEVGGGIVFRGWSGECIEARDVGRSELWLKETLLRLMVGSAGIGGGWKEY
jgi:hypothetical protein